MNLLNKPTRQIKVITPQNLYKWSRVFNLAQRKFYKDPVKLRREKQIEDFVVLNEFNRVHFIIDNDSFGDILHRSCTDMDQADLVLITDQKFSRYPCPEIIHQINCIMQRVPNLYLCLNRCYVNIDNSFVDTSLSDNWSLATTQWLKKNLTHHVVDMSIDYSETGKTFTWAIPDRHYFISKQHD